MSTCIRFSDNGVRSALFTWCGPANILRRIRAIVLDPVKTQALKVPVCWRSRQTEDVFKESNERQAPAGTNIDSPAAVFAPALIPFVITTIFHHSVSVAKRVIRKAVPVITFSKLLRMQASTTRALSTAQVPSINVPFSSAVAVTTPKGFLSPDQRSFSDDKPSAESFPSQYNHVHKCVITEITNKTLTNFHREGPILVRA